MRKQLDTKNDQMLTTKQAAVVLNLNPGTLRHWRSRGEGPKYLRYGRSVRYRRRDLIAFGEQQAA